MTKVQRQSGFTLVELLVVAIILAILAAIAIPQFASTTTDAQESALRSNLSAVRGAIDLYRQQHNEYPALSTSAGAGGSCTGTDGTGALETQAALEEQLTRYTDMAGQSCSTPDAGTFPFGPYLQDDTMPANPITGSTAVVIVGAMGAGAGDLEMAGDGPAAGGWKYDVLSGKFIANDTNADSGGVVTYDNY